MQVCLWAVQCVLKTAAMVPSNFLLLQCRYLGFTFVSLFIVFFLSLQEKEGCHSSLYTLKWFMQCFLDRVSGFQPFY